MSLITSNSPADSTTTITADEFALLPDTKGMELIDGRLVEKNVGTKSGWIGGRLYLLIALFLQDHPLGWVFPSEAIYQCFPTHPNRLRKPDVSFIRSGRLTGERIPDPYIPIAPDLAAEVISPRDTAIRVEKKVRQYLDAGVRLVWVIYPDVRMVHIYRADGTTTVADEQARVEGENVLPGFGFAVTDLFPAAVS